MGELNLFKGGFRKSVGVVTGSKLRGSLIAKTKPQPSNPDTLAQQKIRRAFKSAIKFFAAFADFARRFVRVDKKGFSAYNQLVSNNKNRVYFAPLHNQEVTLRLTFGTLPGVIFLRGADTVDFSTLDSSFSNAQVTFSQLNKGGTSLATFTINADGVLYSATLPANDIKLHIFIVQCITEHEPVITNCTMSDVFEVDCANIPVGQEVARVSNNEISLQFPMYDVCAKYHCFAFAFFSGRLAGRQLVSNSSILYPFIDSANNSPYAALYEYVKYCVDMLVADGCTGLTMPDIPIINNQFNQAMQFVFTNEEDARLLTAGSDFGDNRVLQCDVTAPLLSGYCGYENACHIPNFSNLRYGYIYGECNEFGYDEWRFQFIIFPPADVPAYFQDKLEFYRLFELLHTTSDKYINSVYIVTCINIFDCNNNGIYTSSIPGIVPSQDNCYFTKGHINGREDAYVELSLDLNKYWLPHKDHYGVCLSSFCAFNNGVKNVASDIAFINYDCYVMSTTNLFMFLYSMGIDTSEDTYVSNYAMEYIFKNKQYNKLCKMTKDYDNTIHISDAPRLDVFLCDSEGVAIPVTDYPPIYELTITKGSSDYFSFTFDNIYVNGSSETNFNAYWLEKAIFCGFNNNQDFTIDNAVFITNITKSAYAPPYFIMSVHEGKNKIAHYSLSCFINNNELYLANYATLMFYLYDGSRDLYSYFFPVTFHINRA